MPGGRTWTARSLEVDKVAPRELLRGKTRQACGNKP